MDLQLQTSFLMVLMILSLPVVWSPSRSDGVWDCSKTAEVGIKA